MFKKREDELNVYLPFSLTMDQCLFQCQLGTIIHRRCRFAEIHKKALRTRDIFVRRVNNTQQRIIISTNFRQQLGHGAFPLSQFTQQVVNFGAHVDLFLFDGLFISLESFLGDRSSNNSRRIGDGFTQMS